MMNCLAATASLSAAQEHELALSEQAELERHLAICRSCRDFGRQVEFLRLSMRAYATRPEDDAERDASQ